MRESCTSGSVRGVLSNEHPYRDRARAVTPAVQRLARRAHARAICTADRMGKSRRTSHSARPVKAICPRCKASGARP